MYDRGCSRGTDGAQGSLCQHPDEAIDGDAPEPLHG